MAQQFNCSQTHTFACSEQAVDDVDSSVFCESESEGPQSETLRATDDELDDDKKDNADGEVFFSSSDESEAYPEQPAQKRQRYNQRSNESAKFLGKPVCRRALAALLGIGGSTLQRLRGGESAYTQNARKPLAKHPTFGFAIRGETGKVWEQIVMFFYFLYHSAAEVMPTNWLTIKQAGSKQVETPFPEDDASSENRLEDLQRLVNSIGRTLNTFTTDVECQMIGPGTFAGPRRCLQHGSRTDLFWEYMAFCQSRSIAQASYSTFMKVASSIMKPGLRDKHLMFRKKSEHAQCDFCFNATERIRKARSADLKMAEERELVRHRLAQWQDRQCYWAFRSMSQAYFSNAIVSNDRWLDFECKTFVCLFLL